MDNNYTPLPADALTITSSNGYVVKLKRKELLWSEKKQVNAILNRSFNVGSVSVRELNETKGKAFQDAKVSLDLTANTEATEKIFDCLVKSITTPSGEVIASNFLDWLNKQVESIAEPIFTAFDKATASIKEPSVTEEKKS